MSKPKVIEKKLEEVRKEAGNISEKGKKGIFNIFKSIGHKKTNVDGTGEKIDGSHAHAEAAKHSTSEEVHKTGFFGALSHLSLKKNKVENSIDRKEDQKTPESRGMPGIVPQSARNAEEPVAITGLDQVLKNKEMKPEKPKAELLPISKEGIKLISTYDFVSDQIPITIKIYKKKGEFVPIYEVSISIISKNTEIILEKIREELTTQVSLGMVDILSTKDTGVIEQRFIDTITNLINKHFPDADEKTTNFLKSYLIQRSLGLGNIEILMDDIGLEEIAVNSADEPVWVYHKKYGWLKTNVCLKDEDQTRHYATMIGRRVGRQLTILEPLMDANLKGGDRVNATLEPISVAGNTITLRKFAAKPWTITDFVKDGTISTEAAALVWLGTQFELSTLISGGTATGKTSMLNVVANFFPPNQRIISIEDTREVQLPKFLHWVPMVTRLPNPEGKGEVAMLDLLVNSLRMRPDRIIVGEIRRKREAEVLFEAIHTGHSVYATVHANDASETITRLTNPPIEIPKSMLPAISMIVVQYRNRRTGQRKTFQIAEILPDSNPNVLIQLDIRKGVLKKVANSKSLMSTIELFTGFSRNEIKRSITEKEAVLKWLAKREINTVDGVGRVMAEYYTNKDNLMGCVKKNKMLND